MSKVSSVKPYLTEVEIKEKLRTTVGFWRVQRWLVILHALVDPKPAAEIAQHTGLAKQTVNNLICRYNRIGPEAVESPGRGCRGRAYMTLEEEEQFLKPFIGTAIKGEITTVAEIKRSFEERVGDRVHKSTIYRLLARHGWRKVVPRPRPVDADKQKQEEFKKKLFRSR